ncbi:MAG: MFS transporter [Chloroflexi bacterium]|nr:MFS transporter [Chloroflexota bacterium]
MSNSYTLSPNGTLALVCGGVFLASLDQTSVVTALPEVMLDLGITIDRLDSLAWMVTAYLLGFTVAMPLLGRVGDIYGHRRLYAGALAVFAVGSVGVGLADSLGWLLVGRVAQAIGGGALIPAALALGSEGVSIARRGLVLGIVGASAEMGAVLGPLYGGLLIHTLGWRWIFWTNLAPIALLALGLLFVRESARQGRRLDLAGGLLLAAGLGLLTVALAQRTTFSGGMALPYVIVAGSLTLLALLIVAERKVSEPILARGLFLSRRFVAAFSSQLLVGSALIMALVTVPLMANTVAGESPLEGGLRLVRFTGAMPLGALAGGYASRWIGYRAPTVLGVGLAALGFFMMSGWDADVADPALTLHLAVGGLGFGLVIAPLLASAIETGGTEYRGTAAALITASRMLGMTLGLAALSAWGVGHFQLLTGNLAFPFPFAGETTEAFQLRQVVYQDGVAGASMELFSAFFRLGAFLSLAAIVPALWLSPARKAKTLLS